MLNRAASAALGLGLTIAIAAACNSSSATDGAGSLKSDDVIFLALAESPNLHMEALFNGTVNVDEAGCIRLQREERSTVVWPYGSTLDDTGTELRVRDANGRVLGRLGGTFRFGGGHVPSLHDGIALSQTQREHARATCPGDFWIVGDTD